MRLLIWLVSATMQTGGAPAEGRITRLTHTNARNGQAFWSPDASLISFVSNRSGSWQVWVMAADGSDTRQVTRHTEPVGWPSWRPDGERILFYAGTEEQYRMYSVDLAGGESELLMDDDFSNFRPSMSPDGRRLLFDRFPPNHDLYVLENETGALTQLTEHPGYDSDGRWSPDGDRIVFHSDRGRRRLQTHVYVMGFEDHSLQALTHGDAKNSYPSWSPDGKKIAYTSESGGNRDLWVIDADGTDATRLTYHPGKDSEPVWFPDGTRILFATDRFGEYEELAVLEVN